MTLKLFLKYCILLIILFTRGVPFRRSNESNDSDASCSDKVAVLRAGGVRRARAVTEPSEAVRSSIVRTLTDKKDGNDLEPVDTCPVIIDLPGEARISHLCYPVSLQGQFLKTLEKGDGVRRIGSLPLVRNTQDRFSTTQLAVRDNGAFKGLIELLEKEHLDARVSLSGAHAPCIAVNGCVSPLEMDFIKNPRDLIATFGESDEGMGNSGRATLPFRSSEEETLQWNNLLKLANREAQKVRLGPCSYLAFNPGVLLRGTYNKKILDHLAILSQSRDYCINFDQMGNLILIALHERAAGGLLTWGEELRDLTHGTINLLFGTGETARADANNLVIDNYMTHVGNDYLQRLAEIQPDFYSTDFYLRKMQGSRDETRVKVETAGDPLMGFVPIEVHKRVEYLAGGGPDRLIGYTQEFNDIKDALTGKTSHRLVFLEGSAGEGKSRLISAVTDRMPNVIKISIDPGGRGIPGFSLIDFADQLSQFVLEKFDVNTEEVPANIQALLDFAEKTKNEKDLVANQDPEAICELCQKALLGLEEELGKLILSVDDIHHNDRLSDGYIMDIAGAFVRQSKNSNTIMMRRPEKRYASLAQDNLKRSVKNCLTVSLHDSDNKPKLNFKDRNITRDYVLYSLPEELRLNPETNENRELGEWAYTLGENCKSPFNMTSYMKDILAHRKDYLIIDKNRVELTPEGLERVQKVQGKEMVIYHLENIREQLLPDELMMLQAFAMVGFKNSKLGTIQKFMELAFGFPAEKTAEIMKILVEKGYLVSDSQSQLYRIWHENLRDIVLARTLEENTREDMAVKVYKAASECELVSDDQQFQIMHYAVRNKPLKDGEFWNDYMKCARNTLETAGRSNMYEKGYAVATMILDNMDIYDDFRPEGCSTMTTTLTDLTYGEKIDENFKKFIIDALAAVIFHGYYIGEMENVYKAIQIAEKIQENFPDQNVGLAEFYEIGFDAAYFQSNKEKMIYFYDKLPLESFSEEKRHVYEIQMAYRKRQIGECRRILAFYTDEKAMPVELRRLKYRIEIQGIVKELADDGVEGDAALLGQGITPEQVERARKVYESIKDFRNEFFEQNKNGNVSNKRNNPIMELSLLDIEGDALTFLGNYDGAVTCFSEIWRLSMQMNIPRSALFAAKRKGDLEIMKSVMALRGDGPLEERLALQQKMLNSAIYTYMEEGNNVAQKLTDKEWLLLFCIQRLRAICMKIQSYIDGGVLGEDTEKLMQMAMEDIESLETSDWAKALPSNYDAPLSDLADCYYVTPYVCYFRQLCDELSCSDWFPEEPYSFEYATCVSGALRYAEQFKDDDMGEKQRKMSAVKSSGAYAWLVSNMANGENAEPEKPNER